MRLRSGNETTISDRQLGRDDAEADREPGGRRRGPGRASAPRPMWTVESSTSAAACRATAPSASSDRKRWTSSTDAAFTARPNGRDLTVEPGEHRAREQHVGGQAARPRQDPEGRVAFMRSPPASAGRPSAVTSTPEAELVGLRSAPRLPARKSAFASTSASTASPATTVTRRRSLLGRRAGRGSIRWCSSRPPRRQCRRSRPEVASAPPASSSVSGRRRSRRRRATRRRGRRRRRRR